LTEAADGGSELIEEELSVSDPDEKVLSRSEFHDEHEGDGLLCVIVAGREGEELGL